MAKTKQKPNKGQDMDGVFLLKLVLYLILGSLWLKMDSASSIGVSVPAGLIVGLIFATHEHFRIDRKIEYAVLLVAMLVGYFVPYGLYIHF